MVLVQGRVQSMNSIQMETVSAFRLLQGTLRVFVSRHVALMRFFREQTAFVDQDLSEIRMEFVTLSCLFVVKMSSLMELFANATPDIQDKERAVSAFAESIKFMTQQSRDVSAKKATD